MFSQTDSSILNQQPQLSLLGKSASLLLLVAGCAELAFLKVITPQSVVEHSEIPRIANSVPAMLVHLAENASSAQQENQESRGDKGSQDFANRDRLFSSCLGKRCLAAYEIKIKALSRSTR